ncbi:negative elongation factor E-like [Amblyraja radiata]|uniref:negative elongation factor E-like n=1 Tax=Amblyraja radiata TaxID=386614 RepID=UPI001402E8A6|nr:negative elongation factor E-like [Amblyraja radiata]
MLVKTGAISAITAENKNSGFKHSHTLEGKLKRKYSTLRKQKKVLLAFKKQSSGAQSSKGGIKRSLYDQSLTDTATTTVEAKMLVKTGAISAITAENKNSGFKRSHTLEGKLKVRECTW